MSANSDKSRVIVTEPLVAAPSNPVPVLTPVIVPALAVKPESLLKPLMFMFAGSPAISVQSTPVI